MQISNHNSGDVNIVIHDGSEAMLKIVSMLFNLVMFLLVSPVAIPMLLMSARQEMKSIAVDEVDNER